MKKILLAALPFLITMPAHAEWIRYAQLAESEEWFDPAIVRRDQDRITFWTMTNYVAPITSLEGQELFSEQALTTVDCSAGKIGSEKVIKYAGKNAQGAIIGSMETTLRMTKIGTNAADRVLLEKICAE